MLVGRDPGGPLGLSLSIIEWTMSPISKNVWPGDESRELSCTREDAYKKTQQSIKNIAEGKSNNKTQEPTFQH